MKKTTHKDLNPTMPSRTAIAIAMAMAAGLSAGSVSAAEYELKIGTVESASGSNTLGWKVFEQYVESNSGGEIEVDILHSSELGDTEEMLEATMAGIHKMAQGDSTITGAYDPMMPWLMPYLFNNEVEMKQFFESDTFAELNEQMASDLGVRVLSGTPYGFYSFINAERPIKTLDDLDGLKLRTLPGNELQVEAWEALGASPTPTPWPEIYTSLDTGVLDGLGHTPGIMVDQRFYEVTDYVTLDNSMGVANFYLINEEFYQSLPDDMKEVIETGAEMGADVEFGIATQRNRVESIEKLEEEGMEIHTLAPDERERFREVAHEQLIPWLKEEAGEDVVEAVFDEVDRIQSQ